MITRTVTKVVLVSIFIVGCCPVVFIHVGEFYQWHLNPQNQSVALVTSLGVGGKVLKLLYSVSFFLYGGSYPIASWFTVTVCTAFLIIKLKQNSKWRELTATPACIRRIQANRKQMSARENRLQNRLTKTVVMVTCVFILCSLPVAVNLAVGILVPGYFFNGTLRYLYRINVMVCLFLGQINSSINIFVYTVLG